MDLAEYYSFRNELVADLVRDLEGPGAPDEVIDDPPITRYITGILYPVSPAPVDPSEDVDEPDEGDESPSESPVTLAHVRYPSSMGMTFAVDVQMTSQVLVDVRAARYVPVEGTADTPAASGRAAGSSSGLRWRRESLTCDPVPVDVSGPVPGRRDPVSEGLELFSRVRGRDACGRVLVTLALVNTNRVAHGPRDAHAFFQVGIAATSPDPGCPAIFVEPSSRRMAGTDEDLDSYRLVYRHARGFAVGHGCSVEWRVKPDDDSRATAILTTFTPSHELLLADSNPDIRSPALGLEHLAQSSRDEILRHLGDFCQGYAAWIAARRVDLQGLPSDLHTVGDNHLAMCDQALTRMRRGVDLLRTHETAWRAFQYMNAAMLELRTRTERLRGEEPTSPTWRPFQLAFVLLCLEGICDPSSSDRDIADLLWFPTGGGKTEAYLGLIAFTAFFRRLSKPHGGGVTAIMRYTLRLLTVQQFQRAALLVCCCEALRKENAELGDAAISIGLWVGQDATPNTLDDAEKALAQLKRGGQLEKQNPVQLHACPWCGKPLNYTNYTVTTSAPRRLRIACGGKDCRFSAGLPVYVVDEDVYRHRPTLIIATSDKFAALPWRDEAGALFNLRSATDQPRPDLIIQDELHLISGPLGTLAGLYETAVDLLAAEAGHRPKVIASTATIRRAADQARALFDRRVFQFPPQGLDARDSYFAVEATSDRRGSRLYVGLMAPGTSHTSVLVRAYAALLQGAADFNGGDEVKDAYWTLVGYFNSLRVLGGARMQVQDDVNDRINFLARQSGRPRRPVEETIELTSREPSSAIPAHLAQMARRFGSDDCIDVILATNMISVGVDIDRLGLMAVMGQPQATSEYIQATSRVGRRYPGLVVTLFNSTRSRDRSHYESFVAYHSALYRQVEATSVTPFSARARDRGLHAVLVALARLLVGEFQGNSGAAAISAHQLKLRDLVDAIVARAKAVAPDEAAATEAQLKGVLERWEGRAANVSGLLYGHADVKKALLVRAAEGPAASGDAFPTMWSLRDVDRETNLFLI